MTMARVTHCGARVGRVKRAQFSTKVPPGSVVGSAGWPPGLHVFQGFGAPSPAMAAGVVKGARELMAAVDTAAHGNMDGPRNASIPQPVRSQAHNLAKERTFVPLRVRDPAGDAVRRCEHFAEYGSRYHALTYFRGNENIPGAMDPILEALRELDVIRALSTDADTGGDALGLHWKLTLNHYKPRLEDDAGEALAEAGGALFPWHTDLAANGEMTAIATLLAPAMLEFAPRAGSGCTARCRTPTRPARSASRSCSAARPRRPPSPERSSSARDVPFGSEWNTTDSRPCLELTEAE